MDNNVTNANNADNTSSTLTTNVSTTPVSDTNVNEVNNQTEQSKSYLNISNVTSKKGVTSKNATNVTALDSIEDMSEERRAYVLEKEALIAKRNKRRKAIIKNTFIFIFLFILLYGYQHYFRPVDIDERIDKNSIHYLTDLYYSDGRYYEEYLDEKGKKVYLDIFNSLKNVEKYLTIDCRTYGYEGKADCANVVSLSYDLILLEHPDMFWYRGYSFKYGDQIGIDITHHLVTTNKLVIYFTEKRLLRKMDTITKDLESANDYDKIKGVYTWLGSKHYTDGLKTRKDGTAWSALLDNETVCAGYAAASQLLFQRLGIKSTVVTGNTTGPHAWNFVFYDDGYYWYDATVGGSYGKDSPYFYNGFLFKNTGNYSVDIFDDEYFYWGVDHLES